MATSADDLGDTSSVRRAFLEAVVSAPLPIRARDLRVAGLDRRALQKRLERLRRKAGGGVAASDEQLVPYARTALALEGAPLSRGLLKLDRLATQDARAFAEAAGLQSTPIGDWVELVRSPGDKGWQRSEIAVEELTRGSLFARGKAQSWLAEKKQYLRRCWTQARGNPAVKRNLVPNQLKMDLLVFRTLGTKDSSLCAIQVAPVDWQTCFALNSRLDTPSLTTTAASEQSVRERWGDPRRVAERRGLPGMLVVHIVVETSDRRLLVCLRQAKGIEDEPGTWSLSIEERWTARAHRSSGPEEADRCPHDVVRRALHEELGIDVSDDQIRVLAWGLEQSVLYPGFIAIARAPLGSWEIEGLRPHAADSNELRFVSSIPARPHSLDLLQSEHFAPEARPELRRRWHRTAKARLFAAVAHICTRDGGERREEALSYLGSRFNEA